MLPFRLSEIVHRNHVSFILRVWCPVKCKYLWKSRLFHVYQHFSTKDYWTVFEDKFDSQKMVMHHYLGASKERKRALFPGSLGNYLFEICEKLYEGLSWGTRTVREGRGAVGQIVLNHRAVPTKAPVDPGAISGLGLPSDCPDIRGTGDRIFESSMVQSLGATASTGKVWAWQGSFLQPPASPGKAPAMSHQQVGSGASLL